MGKLRFGIIAVWESIEGFIPNTDEEKAYILPAKMIALTVYKLLKEDAIQAKEIIQGFQPVFDREGYCRYVENSLKTETADSRKQEA